jgi:hypothetical protein
MPSRPVLVGLLLLAVVPPFLARALGSGLFAFGMFTRIERYHIEVHARTAIDERKVQLRSLAPHLSHEARRILIPADGYAAGTEQIELVEGGLADVGRLVCELTPEAISVRIDLFRGPMPAPRAPLARRVEVPCRSAE